MARRRHAPVRSCCRPRSGKLAGGALVLLAATLAGAGHVCAQTLNDRLSAQAPSGQKGRLLVEAREIVYDNDNSRVEARGDVQLYYQGRTLEADRVVYDQKTKRVFAEGNARLTEPNKQVTYSDRFELTDDFKDGFIDSLRVTTADNQRFTARRAERSDGETTVFEQGIYTACEPCKKNPEKPPLWQVKAARIIAKNSEQTIYYEDATLEFFGQPVAWIPFFSAPDPSVRRKSGVLSPRFVNKTSLGYGVSIPVYWAIAPNYDLLFTPTYLTRQGFLAAAEFRHRLETGSYNIRASGIFQQDRNAFLTSPFGAGDRTFRGSLESAGRFFINDKWKVGWDVSLSTDKYYFQNYNIRSDSLTNSFFKESISQVYLTGQTSRSFFDLRGYYFRGLSQFDWQKQLPIAAPVLDYNKRFNIDGIGGEFAFNGNLTAITRDAAQFFDLPDGRPNFSPQRLFTFLQNGVPVGAYEGCVTYERGRCILRGIGGTYVRGTAEVTWRRQVIDDAGQVWTPFAGVQIDGTWTQLNTSRYLVDPNDPTVYGNDKQRNFLDPDADFAGRVMPTVGVEYRYPLVARTGSITHVVEPIAQVIARPDETRIGRLPNEDAQSLVFDDTSIFQWNKFSGYDRTEGGVRANVAGQYTATFANSGYANVLFGQSYQLAGRNSFARGDLANTGLASGLESNVSDFVGRLAIAPTPGMTFSTRARFDEQTFNVRRLEIQGTASNHIGSISGLYARYDAQPELGFDTRREGFLTSAKLNLPANWFVTGNVLFDLDRFLTNRGLNAANGTNLDTSRFQIASLGLGIGYQDECTTLSLSYQRGVTSSSGSTRSTTQLFMVRLELKHLGQINYSQNTGSAVAQDGGIAP